MKKALVIAGIVAIALIAGKGYMEIQKTTGEETGKSSERLKKGAYFASEFAEYKKENVKPCVAKDTCASEKVLFKTFVKYKEKQVTN